MLRKGENSCKEHEPMPHEENTEWKAKKKKSFSPNASSISVSFEIPSTAIFLRTVSFRMNGEKHLIHQIHLAVG
jgi:hypothetical protein